MQKPQLTAQNIYSFLQNNAIPMHNSPYASHGKSFFSTFPTKQSFKTSTSPANSNPFEKGIQSSRLGEHTISPQKISKTFDNSQQANTSAKNLFNGSHQSHEKKLHIEQPHVSRQENQSAIGISTQGNEKQKKQQKGSSQSLLDIIFLRSPAIYNEIKDMQKFSDVSELVSLLSNQIDDVIEGLSLRNVKDQEEIIGRTKLKLKLLFEVIEKSLQALEDHKIEFEKIDKLGQSNLQDGNEFLISDFQVPWENKLQDSEVPVTMNIQSRMNRVLDNSPQNIEYIKGVQTSQRIPKEDNPFTSFEFSKESLKQPFQVEKFFENMIQQKSQSSSSQSSTDTLLV